MVITSSSRSKSWERARRTYNRVLNNVKRWLFSIKISFEYSLIFEFNDSNAYVLRVKIKTIPNNKNNEYLKDMLEKGYISEREGILERRKDGSVHITNGL